MFDAKSMFWSYISCVDELATVYILGAMLKEICIIIHKDLRVGIL